MTFALLELLPALLILFLLGLIIGWLVWRWRRRLVSSSEWNNLSNAANRAKSDLASAEAANAELSNERSALSKQVSSLNGQYETTRTELGTATRTNETLGKQVEERDIELARLRGELDDRDGKLALIEGDLDNANTKISGFANIEGEAEQLRGQVESSGSRIAELEGELGKSKSELASNKEALAKSNDQVNNKDAELAKLRTELENANGELAGRDGKIGKLEAAVAASAATAAAMKAMESDNGDLKAQLQQALDARDAEAARAKELGSLVDSTRSDLDGAHGRVAELEGELGAAQGQVAELTPFKANAEATGAQLNDANGRIGELEGQLAELQQLRDQRDGANSRIDELEGQLGDMGQLQEQLNGANSRVAELEGQLQEQLNGANSRVAELEGQLGAAQGQVAELTPFKANAEATGAQLNDANGRIGELEGQLAELQQLRDQRDAANGQLDDANGRIGELEGQLAELQQLRDQRDAANGQLDDANGRIGELEGQLVAMGQLQIDITERDRRIEELELAAQQSAQAQADLDALRRQLDEANQLVDKSAGTIDTKETVIIDLRKQLADKEAEAEALPEPLRRVASFHAGSWKVGTTKLGTAGADHTDDLKVVSGIGPQMEKLLNSFGITSWEQLAALTPEEVATVDAALEDFPGRITRDEWVEQAQDIMDAGHKPVKRAPKARPAPAAPSWQKGTTKLGTAGASHTDDLKCINGIGPKMEKLLNSFDITAWEQLANLSKAEVNKVDDALQQFPGRITRDEWVEQAGELVKQFPNHVDRPSSKNFLHRSTEGVLA